MSDLFGNDILGFPTRRLNYVYKVELTHMMELIILSYYYVIIQNNTVTAVTPFIS